jgi:hypothetical protein
VEARITAEEPVTEARAATEEPAATAEPISAAGGEIAAAEAVAAEGAASEAVLAAEAALSPATVSLEGMKPDEATALVWAKLRAWAAAAPSQSGGDSKAWTSGVLGLFQQLDLDSSGTIDAKEFKAALAAVGLRGASNKVVEAVMKAAAQAEGASGSKKALDYASFAAALSPAKTPPNEPNKAAAALRAGGGSVSPVTPGARGGFQTAQEVKARALFSESPARSP